MPRPRVLIVEDNIDDQNRLRRILESIGCEVAAEPNGKLALRHARREPPDIIFMDMRLPMLDGLEVLEKLRQCRGLEKVPVVALSGYAYAALESRAIERGCCAFLEKPLSQAEVKQKLTEILGYEPE